MLRRSSASVVVVVVVVSHIVDEMLKYKRLEWKFEFWVRGKKKSISKFLRFFLQLLQSINLTELYLSLMVYFKRHFGSFKSVDFSPKMKILSCYRNTLKFAANLKWHCHSCWLIIKALATCWLSTDWAEFCLLFVALLRQNFHNSHARSKLVYYLQTA